jgi:hypothetical protein
MGGGGREEDVQVRGGLKVWKEWKMKHKASGNWQNFGRR